MGGRRLPLGVAGRGGTAKSESGEAPERRYKGVARPSSRASSSDSSRFSLNSNRATATSKRSHPSSDTSNTVGPQTNIRVTSTQIHGMSRLSTERRGVGQRVEDKSDGAVLPDASTATTWSSRLNGSASSRNSDRPTRVIDDSGHVNTNSSKKTMQKKNIISATSAEDIRQYFRT